MVLTTFTVPLLWVAALVVVELYPVPWQEAQLMPREFTWKACSPVAGGVE